MDIRFVLPILAVMLLLAFGCTSTAPAVTGASSPMAPEIFRSTGALTNNSTGDAITLGAVLTTHAYGYTMGGNWTTSNGMGNKVANITLQGSLDGTTWAQMSSVLTNISGITTVTASPIVYARILVLGWNATAGNASVANLTVTYVGSKS
jgi:hypothetical protein